MSKPFRLVRRPAGDRLAHLDAKRAELVAAGQDTTAVDTVRWWVCPNQPPCPHGAVVHDVEDFDDRLPRCCVEGCGCGQKGADDGP